MPTDRDEHPQRPRPTQDSYNERDHRSSGRRQRRPSEGERATRNRPQRSPPKKSSVDAHPRQTPYDSSKYNTGHMTPSPMMDSGDAIGRKKSLIRPERRRQDPHDPNYFYRQHAHKMDVRPSATGNDPTLDEIAEGPRLSDASTAYKPLGRSMTDDTTMDAGRKSRARADAPGRLQKRTTRAEGTNPVQQEMQRQKQKQAAQAPSLWNAYCQLITIWCPDAVLKCFGKPEKAQQRAWREKMGLISVILLIAAFVGFLTFGFTATVCPAGGGTRLRVNEVDRGFLIVHGVAYDLSRSQHPYARGIPDGSNVLFDLPEKHGGQDASFLFQNVNGHCKGLITAAAGSDVPTNSNGDLGWYFPCNIFNQDGSTKANTSVPYYLGYSCHLSSSARSSFYGLKSSSDVYFTWDDIRNSTRNLAVFGSDVIDLNLLEWFNKTQVSYPSRFDDIRTNPLSRGTDLTLAFTSPADLQMGKCFSEIIKVGSIDTESIGCIASKVVLYVSLVFILAIVTAKFVLALAFQWFLSRRYGATKGVQTDSKKRAQEIEDWTNDIYRPPPKLEDSYAGTLSERSARSSAFLPTKSRFTSPYAMEGASMKGRSHLTTMTNQAGSSTTRLTPYTGYQSDLSLSQHVRDSRVSMLAGEKNTMSVGQYESSNSPGFIHEAVVPQPPPEWQPFGYPLAHTICLVTAYSEGQDALRTTFDSVATTDYPNSHKIMLVICDGLIRGKGEEFSTPDIALGMMKEHTILPDEVQAYSYVAVASGSKRHNMAKIYSGFYDYGEDSIVPQEKQQRVPMVVVVKCGTPDEAVKSKPGNRGKRDSQIILMSFLQKVMFDERMTELEFEMFNGIWKITGISPDFYEVVLMVDADTKVFPDSVTHMVSAMVKDPEIMGLCGETKIANKRDSWVTMIQVFEYFISHHLAKSFESVFGGVTCLPGCFCMYRIKAPKGGQNYWVPILANPDIVEHYSENVVDTLHKKNLLLLGEDRFLSTLMLRTFPKRKQVFVPQAICKTTVPDAFKVLLSQRRRWINSTIHNLMELVLVRDLCGTFCFSMQFVVFIELVGTLVLPAAISFTVYLIVISIISGVKHTPIPVIPLVLLALILGLPAILIVLTAHRWSYVLWMGVYLLSLPIWNGVLPLYAYWKFDDFSWGDTRKTDAEKTVKGGHGDVEGEFDSSKITMKRWVDFEQERRLRGPGGGWQQTQGYGVQYASNSNPSLAHPRRSHSSFVTDSYYGGEK